MGCPNCGYSEHMSHGSKYCPVCGTQLIGPVTDTREICPPERMEAFKNLMEARKRFYSAGGKKEPD